MANCALNFAYANEEQSFAVLETVCGDIKQPTAGDVVLTVGPVDGVGQELEKLDDEQLRPGASRRTPFRGRDMPGELSLNTYVKPSGTLGTNPEQTVLFESAMGARSTTPGVSVAYTLANQVDSFSFWTLKGHTSFAYRGCTVQRAEFGIGGDEMGGIAWTIQYMEELYAGTIQSTQAGCAPGTVTFTLPTGGAQLYVVGARVTVGTDTNLGFGYRLTGVNYTNDTITIHVGLKTNQGNNPTITPWWPSTATEVGTPVHGKQGLVTINAGAGAASTVVLSARVVLENNIKYYIDEKNNQWTAERFGRPKLRFVDGELELYFLRRGPSYFYRAAWQTANALVIPCGAVAGYIMNINIPYAEYETPRISGDEEFIQNVPFRGIASSAMNDEMNITFV